MGHRQTVRSSDILYMKLIRLCIMRWLVCAFVVHVEQSQAFSRHGPTYVQRPGRILKTSLHL